MFVDQNFIEKYSKRADEITLDGRSINSFPPGQQGAIAAYLYDMYMKVCKHVPIDSLFLTEGASAGGSHLEGAMSEAPSRHERVTNG